MQLKKCEPSSSGAVLWSTVEMVRFWMWIMCVETAVPKPFVYEEYFKKFISSYICMSDLLPCVFKKEEKKHETHFWGLWAEVGEYLDWAQ